MAPCCGNYVRVLPYRGAKIAAFRARDLTRPAPPLYRRDMPLPLGFIAPCLPTKAQHPPTGALWLHEIEHDGFHVIARKDGDRVRLYSRSGNDLTHRFPRWLACVRAL